MKDRIIQFLSTNNLTSTKFADSIGVQRSSISHILSGRNKPSFDFIEKMLITYPDLNAQWLITGKGNMNIGESSLFNQPSSENGNSLTPRESNIQSSIDYKDEKINSEIKKTEASVLNELSFKKDSDLERIVLFYKNGSFKEYKPE